MSGTSVEDDKKRQGPDQVGDDSKGHAHESLPRTRSGGWGEWAKSLEVKAQDVPHGAEVV